MGNTNRKQHYETATKTGVLQISNEKLKEIPPEVFQLHDVLRNLDLSKNKLPVLSDEISKLKHLKQLNIDTNHVEALPESLSNLKKLEILNACRNTITKLPDSFVNLTNLKQIYLRKNKIRHFPPQLLGLKNLEVVDLSANKMTVVPLGMFELYVTELDLSENEISVIGDDLQLAPRLKILKLDENCLSLDAVKPGLLRDSKIQALSIEGNLFEIKKLSSVEGYNEYTERFTAMKKKLF